MRLRCFFCRYKGQPICQRQVTILPPTGWPATADNGGGMDTNMMRNTANLGLLRILLEK
jgi:hypothetical protein